MKLKRSKWTQVSDWYRISRLWYYIVWYACCPCWALNFECLWLTYNYLWFICKPGGLYWHSRNASEYLSRKFNSVSWALLTLIFTDVLVLYIVSTTNKEVQAAQKANNKQFEVTNNLIQTIQLVTLMEFHQLLMNCTSWRQQPWINLTWWRWWTQINSTGCKQPMRNISALWHHWPKALLEVKSIRIMYFLLFSTF